MRDAAALVILQMDKATGISALSETGRGLARSPEAGAASEVLRTTASEENRDDSG
jgi:hypothetical protein